MRKPKRKEERKKETGARDGEKESVKGKYRLACSLHYYY